MLHTTTVPLVFDGSSGNQVHVAGIGDPPVVHGNAGDGKAFYGRMVSSWREARRQGQPTIAVNLPYFHGVNHFSRDEHVLALLAFLSHVANHTEYLPEAVYDAAFTFHRLNAVDLARLYYIHSLQLGSNDIGDSAASNLAILEHHNGSLAGAQRMVSRALLLDSSNSGLRALNKAFSQVKPYDVGDHSSTSTVVSQQTRDAYSQLATDYLHDILDGPLGDQLRHLFGQLQISSVFRASSYFDASILLCHPTQPPPSRVSDFPFERVVRLFHYMQNSSTLDYCKEFQAGLLGLDNADVDYVNDSNVFDGKGPSPGGLGKNAWRPRWQSDDRKPNSPKENRR